MTKATGRWIELFESDGKTLSMTRLLCFMSFFPATYVAIRAAGTNEAANVLMIYLGAFVLGYVGGKFSDSYTQAATVKAENQAAPNVVVPDAQNVQVKADGDVVMDGVRRDKA